MANYTGAALEGKAFEEDQSPIENWGDNGLNVSVRLRTLWADRYTVLDDIISNWRPYPNLLGTAGAFLAFAATGAITPVGKSDRAVAGEQSLTYEHALLQIQYKPMNYGEPPTPGDPSILFTESLEPNVEFLTVPHIDLVWNADGTEGVKPEDAPGLLLSSFDYVQSQFRVASLVADFVNHVGHVNNAAIVSSLLGFTFPIETLYFNPPTLDRTINTLGASMWNITTRFSYRPQTWNKFLRPDEVGVNNWSPMYVKSGGTVFKPYPLADFSTVIIT